MRGASGGRCAPGLLPLLAGVLGPVLGLTGCAASSPAPGPPPTAASDPSPRGAPAPSIAWELVSSRPDGTVVRVRYRLGGCRRSAEPSVVETPSAVTVTVRVTRVLTGLCPADAFSEEATVTLREPLRDRRLEHGALTG